MGSEQGPHRICRAGLHCLALTGITYDGRCLACRRASHSRAQARYRNTAKGQRNEMNDAAKRRGAS